MKNHSAVTSLERIVGVSVSMTNLSAKANKTGAGLHESTAATHDHIDPSPTTRESDGESVEYALIIPKHTDGPASASWPVKIAFPSVTEAMKLFALAAKGGGILREESQAGHPLQRALVGALREAVKGEGLAKPLNEAEPSPQFMAVKDYAEYRRLSKRSIETLITHGLPLDGRGKLRRVPVENADRWMRERGHSQVDRQAAVAARRAAIKSIRGGAR